MRLTSFWTRFLGGLVPLVLAAALRAQSPAISTQPAAQSVNAGAAASFSVVATGSGLSYQWQKNGVSLSGQTAATLVVTNVQSSDAGNYTVVVSNSAGIAISSAASLSVANGPVFVGASSSAPVIVALGGSVTFTANATGTPTPTYQWSKNGSAIAGATSASLTLSNVQTSAAGNYTVTATNGSGSVTSGTFALNVSQVPSGSGSIVIATSDGTLISGDVDRTNGTLLGGVTPNGATSSVAPKLAGILANGGLYVTQGGSATLTASGSGNPAPGYQWYKNGSVIAGATGASLSLTNVQPVDAGNYTVTATNSAGSATSTGTAVTVASIGSDGTVSIAAGTGQVVNAKFDTTSGALNGGVTSGGAGAVVAPKISAVVSKSDLLLQLGTAATLTVAATGNPTPSYQWYKNGVALSGATATTYTIGNVGTADAGSYKVVATNSAGTSTSAELAVSVSSRLAGSGDLTVATSGGTLIAGTVDATSGALSGTVTTNAASSTALGPRILGVSGKGTATAEQGKSITFAIEASGNPAPSFQWYRGDSLLAGQTGATLTLANVQPADAGFYSVRASNGIGAVSSDPVQFSVTVPGGTSIASGPPILAGLGTTPSSLVVPRGSSAALTVSLDAAPLPTLQWFKDGVALAGQTGYTLNLPNVQDSAAGSYTVRATNSAGSATSGGIAVTIATIGSDGSLTVASANGQRVDGTYDAASGLVRGTVSASAAGRAPAVQGISGAPSSLLANAGSTVTFSALATGTGTLSYQWYRNQAAVPGATGATFTIPAVALADAGTYTVSATNTAGGNTSSATELSIISYGVDGTASLSTSGGTRLAGTITPGGSNPLVIPPTPTPPSNSDVSVVTTSSANSRLSNLSVRGTITDASPTIVAGFVVSGEGSRQLLVRAIGPTLSAFGVPNALASPSLIISSGSQTIAQNTGWSTASNATQTAAAAASTGAFPLAVGAADSALFANLGPGALTATASGANGAKGEALLEVYDATSASEKGSRIINFSSSKQFTASSQVLVAGFAISGTGPRRVLLRAVGPTLTRLFGVASALPAPVLRIYNGSQLLQTAQNWSAAPDSANLALATLQAGAFALPAGTADAVAAVTLSPGTYSVQVSDATGATGLALFEIYELP